MAAEQLEIETKFDVPLTYVVPELAGVEGVASADAPVEHRLEARYFDTADLRLARARITLRRRTGGTDAGWHVKLPATEGARRELHQPLGRATRRPPKAVTAPLAGVLRSAVPGPVAQLRTRRVVTVLRDADGRPLAEVADDTVSATRLSGPDGTAEVRSWREVEVELIEGTARCSGGWGSASSPRVPRPPIGPPSWPGPSGSTTSPSRRRTSGRRSGRRRGRRPGPPDRPPARWR